MKRYRQCAPFLLPLVCVAAVLSIGAQKKESGDDPYTPTKLDWLETSFNAWQAENFETTLECYFAVKERPNTLWITAAVTPQADRKKVNERLATKREALELLAKTYGFNSWLQIREDIHVHEPQSVSK